MRLIPCSTNQHTFHPRTSLKTKKENMQTDTPFNARLGIGITKNDQIQNFAARLTKV